MTVFEFLCPSVSGLAVRGEVHLAAGSAVNTALLLVEPTRFDGDRLASKDPITVWVLPDRTGSKFEVFRGLVSRITREGGFIRIEAATASGAATVKRSSPQSWSNSSVSRILRDLLAMSNIDIASASWPQSLSETILHVWNSDGGFVMDEIQELLQSVGIAPDVYGGPDGRLYIGSPDEIQAFHPLFVWPFDAALGDTDTDTCRFPVRPALPYQPAFDPTTGEAMGLVDVVHHLIDDSGAHTDIILSEVVSPTVQARITSEVVPVDPLDAPSAEDSTDG